MGGERWSAADLNTLKRAYPDWGAEPVAAITGRSIDAVRHMASRLGLEATHHKQRVDGPEAKLARVRAYAEYMSPNSAVARQVLALIAGPEEQELGTK